MRLLYKDHHAWLRRWLQARTGDSWEAADVAHDTFLRLWSREQTIDIREPRALLTVIAKRLLASAFRRRQIEQAYLEALAAQPVPTAPSPERQLLIVEALAEIDRLLAGLPGVVRQAFLLSRLEGLEHAMVAARLGISVTSVKRHIITAGAQFYFMHDD